MSVLSWVELARVRASQALFHAGLLMAGAAIGCGGEDTTSIPVNTGGSGGGGSGGGSSTADSGAPRGPQKLLVLHTNDLHSHLMGFGPERDYTPLTPDDDTTVGGMARLATAIGRARAAAEAASTPILQLDAGDFMMGSLFELLARQEVPELLLMQALGYDATTLGNHELDWTPFGLALILQAASAKRITLPILASNLNFSNASGDTGDDALQALGTLRTKLVKKVGGLQVGMFGLLGADAVRVTPQSRPLTFDPIAVAAARMVTELRETDHVDLVVALSHSGVDENGQGEDADLAAAVPGIDLIISGHTHVRLPQPVKVGDTLIVSAGALSANLGQLALTVTPPDVAGGRASITVDDYTLLDINDSIPGDATTQAAVDAFITGLDSSLLTPRGLGYRQVVAKTGADLILPPTGEAPLGNLVTDAYRAVVSALQPMNPPALAVDANGQLRAPIQRGTTGEIWLADLFRVLPIGIGPDGVPGFPLVTFYVNARDIRSALEFDGATELVGSDVFSQVSGIKAQFDRSQPPFQRVSSLSLVTGAGDQPLDITDTTTCYQIVTTNYVAGLLGLVRSLTSGLLSVDAKDVDCVTPIDPTTRFVDADPTTDGVQELKHWQALLGYLSQLPDLDADGVPDVPAAYATPQGRLLGL